jgi:diacylglycerol kinase (ATP)
VTDPAASSPEPFSARKRARSFRFALRGVLGVLSKEHNAWIHAVATVAVVAGGLLLGVSRLEWGLLILAMVAVWTTEILNTALESLGDATAPDHDPLVAVAKDAAAGAVLVAAIGAALIGVLVLGPHLVALGLS